jgi:hypothetical protein
MHPSVRAELSARGILVAAPADIKLGHPVIGHEYLVGGGITSTGGTQHLGGRSRERSPQNVDTPPA